jgi:sulfopyruvate decarboxylase subunit beta
VQAYRGAAPVGDYELMAMRRKQALETLRPLIEDDLVACCLGGTARDWHSLRPRNTFYVHHAMGLTPGVGLGLSLAQPEASIWAFEGDGGLLMNLGLLAVIAHSRPRNLFVVVMDNELYESGGKLPTFTNAGVDFAGVASACGWEHVATVRTLDELAQLAALGKDRPGPHLLVLKLEPGVDGEPMTIEYVENKLRFERDIHEKLGVVLRRTPEAHSARAAGAAST